jgi:uncharacterized membrane protein
VYCQGSNLLKAIIQENSTEELSNYTEIIFILFYKIYIKENLIIINIVKVFILYMNKYKSKTRLVKNKECFVKFMCDKKRIFSLGL